MNSVVQSVVVSWKSSYLLPTVMCGKSHKCFEDLNYSKNAAPDGIIISCSYKFYGVVEPAWLIKISMKDGMLHAAYHDDMSILDR